MNADLIAKTVPLGYNHKYGLEGARPRMGGGNATPTHAEWKHAARVFIQRPFRSWAADTRIAFRAGCEL